MEHSRFYHFKELAYSALLAFACLSTSQSAAQVGAGVDVGVGNLGVGVNVDTYDPYQSYGGEYYYTEPYYNPGPNVYIGGGYYGGYGGYYDGHHGYYDGHHGYYGHGNDGRWHGGEGHHMDRGGGRR